LLSLIFIDIDSCKITFDVDNDIGDKDLMTIMVRICAAVVLDKVTIYIG